jgi:hypothetical protein
VVSHVFKHSLSVGVFPVYSTSSFACLAVMAASSTLLPHPTLLFSNIATIDPLLPFPFAAFWIFGIELGFGRVGN